MSKILTISIAAYNVEKFIGNTLDSLLVDSQVAKDIEVLVIDDGGKDRTLDIAASYAQKYPETIYPIHKENGGYGSVINLAISKATGKYFKQLDGDDMFEITRFKEYVELLKKVDSDYVVTSMYRFDEKKETKIYEESFPDKNEGFYSCESLDFPVGLRMYCSTYRTDILKSAEYRITEHCFYTDTEYCSFPVKYIQNMYLSHIPVYIYRVGDDEQSISRKSLVKRYKEHEQVLFKLISIYKGIDLKKTAHRNIVKNRISAEIVMQIKIYCMMPLSLRTFFEAKSFWSKIKIEVPEIVSSLSQAGRFIYLWSKTTGLIYPIFHFWFRGDKL